MGDRSRGSLARRGPSFCGRGETARQPTNKSSEVGPLKPPATIPNSSVAAPTCRTLPKGCVEALNASTLRKLPSAWFAFAAFFVVACGGELHVPTFFTGREPYPAN